VIEREFGEILQGLLKEKRLSTAALAREIGVSAKTVHEWLGKEGRMPRRAQHLKKISQVLDVPVAYLLFGDPPRLSLDELIDKTQICTGTYEITVRRLRSGPKG